MSIEAAKQTLTEAITTRTAAVAHAESLPTGRIQTAAWRAVETAAEAVRAATADVERAVRIVRPGATEAAIMAEALAA